MNKLISTKDRLHDLMNLSIGWDGYNAEPISFEMCVKTYALVSYFCSNHDFSPQIIPGADGTIQLEWHLAKGWLEIHIQHTDVCIVNMVYNSYNCNDTCVIEDKKYLVSFDDIKGFDSLNDIRTFLLNMLT